jgi:hypothetical protein
MLIGAHVSTAGLPRPVIRSRTSQFAGSRRRYSFVRITVVKQKKVLVEAKTSHWAILDTVGP